jgi:hypothetical protein
MDNLKNAISGETAEFKDLYPKFIEQAKIEKVSDAIIISFDVANQVEKIHAGLYPPIYLNGTLTQNPDGTATQRARANDIDFTFYYIPKERYIELKGVMQDLRGEDRALQVMYILP